MSAQLIQIFEQFVLDTSADVIFSADVIIIIIIITFITGHKYRNKILPVQLKNVINYVLYSQIFVFVILTLLLGKK